MIFYKQRTFGWRFLVLALLTLFLMVADRRQWIPAKIKSYEQVLAVPFQYAVVFPEYAFSSIRDYFTLQHELIHDKKNWQDKEIILQAKLQEVNALKLQNQELQTLLNAPAVQQKQHYVLARVMNIKSENSQHEIMLNQGSKLGIQAGQAIVTGEGVVGQVIEVSPLNSRVILLTDARSAIPVTNQRTRQNFIALGTGNLQKLELMNPGGNADIKVGDLFLSSGIGGHYPFGYAVGVVSTVQTHGTALTKVFLTPSAHLDRLHFVLAVFLEGTKEQ